MVSSLSGGSQVDSIAQAVIKLAAETVRHQKMGPTAKSPNVFQRQHLTTPDVEGQLPMVCTVR